MNADSSNPRHITRRRAARLLGGGLLASAAASTPLAAALRQITPAAPSNLSAQDAAFLDDMQRRGCLYFAEQAGPNSGQVLDRAINKTSTGRLDTRFTTSIAATGFGLSALCIADKRGYLPAERIRRQVLTTLRFHLNNAARTRLLLPLQRRQNRPAPHHQRSLLHRYRHLSLRRPHRPRLLQ